VAWYNEPSCYYGPGSDALSQGDIVIAPTTVLRAGTGASGIVGPMDLGEERETGIWLAGASTLPGAPDLSAKTRWGLAMVIPHPCAMEKEWNERVGELMSAGHSADDAAARATQDTDLDPFVTVAPLILYESIPSAKHSGIRANQRLGNFPVCPRDLIPDAFVDFNRLTTLHYTLIPRSQRVAALTDLAVAHLHHALVMHFAYRSASGLSEIEKAVGQTINSVTATARAKRKLIVNIVLSNGEALTLESQDITPRKPTQRFERPPRV